MKALACLRLVRTARVCLPDSAGTAEDVLSVVLGDDLLSELGAGPGHQVIISMREPPRYGEPGGVCYRGKVYVGYLFFSETGGVMLGSANATKIAAYFEPGTYEVVGRVDRVCSSCETRSCRVVPRRTAPVVSAGLTRELEAELRAFREEVGMLRWRTDADGRSTVSDDMRAWITLLGGDPEEWEGDGWTNFLHPEDRDAFLFRWREAVETGKPYQNQGRMCVAGLWLWMAVSGNPVRDDAGQTVGWEGFLHLEPVEKRLSA